jgi:hypothetical protein
MVAVLVVMVVVVVVLVVEVNATQKQEITENFASTFSRFLFEKARRGMFLIALVILRRCA